MAALKGPPYDEAKAAASNHRAEPKGEAW